MSTLTCTTLGQIDLDAKSCYDCIIRLVDILACYKFDFLINVCCWLMMVMESQQHHVITSNSRSTRAYSSTPTHPLHGAGQGSSSAPMIWLLISLILFISTRQWTKGVRWASPTQEPDLIKYTDAFVDDTTL